MARRALITGISGQDGSYLAELLLARGYEVHGCVRRVALHDDRARLARLAPIADRLTLHPVALESEAALSRLLRAVAPDEVYHLAAQSFVAESFAEPYGTLEINVAGTLHVLGAARDCGRETRVYFAGSSEMFGNADAPQDERSACFPVSPYGISKLAGYHLARMFREAHGLFVACGILFNHESPRRGPEFVTRRVARAAAEIRLGLRSALTLGDLAARRDWGYAPEYVEAMWRMLQHGEPEDFVVATGETHSVEELVERAFAHAGLDWRDHVVSAEERRRPVEVRALRGAASKARRELGFTPRVRFDELVGLLVDAEVAALEERGPPPAGEPPLREHALSRPPPRSPAYEERRPGPTMPA
jgi:GDPmannose 4,6-dehydratase